MKTSYRARLCSLALSWAGIFLVAGMIDVFTPYTFWGGLVRVPVNFAVAPAFLLTGQYFLFGPRRAKRYWLLLRFILANLNRPNALVEHRNRPRPIHRPAVHPFWWTQRKRRHR